jgi:translocator assembly and maintenance protein 41
MMKDSNDKDPELVRRRQGGPFEQRIASDDGLTKEIQGAITKTIRWPSSVETVKGLFTAGISRTWRYLKAKQDKWKNSGKKGPEPSEETPKETKQE